MPADPIVVLVHGAYHGPWCFEQVATGLAGRGVRSVAVDLPSHGDLAGPADDLHGDADFVRRVLDGVDGPVVLVGHSYGGAVITDAGVHPAVAHLVYVCALVPGIDESGIALMTQEPAPTAAPDERPRLADGMQVDANGVATIDPVIAAAAFYHDCEPAMSRAAAARLRPQSLAWLPQTPRAAAWRTIESTYVVCADDEVISPVLQRTWATRCTTSHEWQSGHSPFLSVPERMVGLLVDVVRRIAAGPSPEA